MSSLIAGVTMLAGVSCIKVDVAITFTCTHMVKLNITCPRLAYDYRKQYAQSTVQGIDD